MKRQSLATVLLVLSGLLFASVTIPQNVRAETLYVGGTGPGNFTTIQEAMNDASAGDTIFVYGGTYYEHVHIWDSISLMGEDRDSTIINGLGSGNVVYVDSDGVSITHLTLTNGGQGYEEAALRAYYSSDLHISDSRMSASGHGIYLRLSSDCTIADNLIHINEEGGIFLEGSSATVSSNTIVYNDGSGIDLVYHADANIVDNFISSNSGSGILMGGMMGMAPTGTTVSRNMISDNNHGITLWNADGNTITDNNIVNNTGQTLVVGEDLNWCPENYWDYNYWSDYTGVDGNGDGIGDTPYEISCLDMMGTSHYDYDPHPRMSPLGTIPGPPANLTAQPGDGNVFLTWLPPVGNDDPVISYSVYRGPSSGTETFLVELGNVTKYKDEGLTNGQAYFYQVAARTLKGEGLRSNEVNATPLPPPMGPFDTDARLVGADLEDIVVTWALSPDDAVGFLERYEIHKGSTYDRNGTGYQLVATLPKGTAQYVDYLAGNGDPNNYFYMVCAVNLNNQCACAESRAGKFTCLLSLGPNLVSIPLLQPNTSIERILQAVNWDNAWSFDSFLQEWQWNMKDKTYSRGLLNVDHTMGLWVNVTEESNLTVAGVVPIQTVMHLHKGWNLVSFPSFNSTYGVSNVKTEIGAWRVEGYGPTTPFHLRAFTDGEMLQAGYGYWIGLMADAVWVVPGS